MAGWPLDTLLVSTKKAEVFVTSGFKTTYSEGRDILCSKNGYSYTMSKNPFDHKDQKLKKGTLCSKRSHSFRVLVSRATFALC